MVAAAGGLEVERKPASPKRQTRMSSTLRRADRAVGEVSIRSGGVTGLLVGWLAWDAAWTRVCCVSRSGSQALGPKGAPILIAAPNDRQDQAGRAAAAPDRLARRAPPVVRDGQAKTAPGARTWKKSNSETSTLSSVGRAARRRACWAVGERPSDPASSTPDAFRHHDRAVSADRQRGPARITKIDDRRRFRKIAAKLAPRTGAPT